MGKELVIFPDNTARKTTMCTNLIKKGGKSNTKKIDAMFVPDSDFGF